MVLSDFASAIAGNTRMAPVAALALCSRWCQQIGKADVSQKLDANPVSNSVDHLGSVLRGINMDTERALAKGCIYDGDNGFRYLSNVGIWRR